MVDASATGGHPALSPHRTQRSWWIATRLGNDRAVMASDGSSRGSFADNEPIPIAVAWSTDAEVGLGGAALEVSLHGYGVELREGLRLSVRDVSGRFASDAILSGVVRHERDAWV